MLHKRSPSQCPSLYRAFPIASRSLSKHHPQHRQEAVFEIIQLLDLGLYWLAGSPAQVVLLPGATPPFCNDGIEVVVGAGLIRRP